MAVVYEFTQSFVRDGTTRSWAIERQVDGNLLVTSHDGASVSIDVAFELRGLREVAERVPGVFTVEPLALNSIVCSKEIRAFLPLLLVATSATSEKLGEDEIADESWERIYWAVDEYSCSPGWLLEVNDAAWCTWDDQLFLPAQDPGDLLGLPWASASVFEPRGIMSGGSWYCIGGWSETVGLAIEKHEAELIDDTIEAFEVTDPAAHVLEWAKRGIDGWAEPGIMNGSLFNAFGEQMLNSDSTGNFPGFAVFRTAAQAADSSLPGTKEDGDLDSLDSLEVSIGAPSPRSRLGRELVKRLKRDWPDLPYFQVAD